VSSAFFEISGLQHAPQMLAAAAHKLHNLQLIAVFQANLAPVRARDNVAVALDRNAIGLQLKKFDEVGQLWVRIQPRKFTIASIDREFHWIAHFIRRDSFIRLAVSLCFRAQSPG
jgi:hypothetical protein